MTFPRQLIVDHNHIGFYHCHSRCVRRAFLCGRDPYSGKDYEHRRKWIYDRLTQLLELFAIDLVSFAILHNHLHLLLRIRPDIVARWCNEEVARRWLMLFPRRRTVDGNEEPSKKDIQEICSSEPLIAEYRARLSSLSWFHRCLKEDIACRANAEDDVTGCFWEGRFKSQKVVGIAGLIACSSYVDLNIVRAGLAESPETSKFTSIYDRIQNIVAVPPVTSPRLLSIEEAFDRTLSTAEYFSLVDSTGRAHKHGKSSIPTHLEHILERIGLKPENWITTTSRFRTMFKVVVGSADELRSSAKNKNRSWFQGISSAKLAFKT